MGLVTTIRRKCLHRQTFITVVALMLTASLAFYHRATIDSMDEMDRLEHEPTNEVIEKIEVDKQEIEYKEAPEVKEDEEKQTLEPIKSTITQNVLKCEELPSESLANFDTSDLYKSIVAGKKPPVIADQATDKPLKNEKLKVFVLPFTHVDPGWLRTFDSYTNDTNQILTNMHQFMTQHEKMRFLWAEFVFFEKWWKMQSTQVKDDVRKLVESGRLELASGSWVMTDEANAYFAVSVDNIVEGMQYIDEQFGVKPSTIWTNDPFGYSNSVPYLFRKAGIKRNVINRIHHSLKTTLQEQHAIPFKWRQYFDNSGDSDVLTQVLPYSHYDVLNSCGPNSHVCCQFDFKRLTKWQCGDQPQPINAKNVASKAKLLVNQLKIMSEMYDKPVILMMHGDDFRYDAIEEWYQQYDNFMPVFDEINKGKEVEIRFGTFDDYFTALEGEYEKSQTSPATLTGDFFPYQCALGDLWTGYYTTRPFYKRQGRYLHSLIRGADLLGTSSAKKLTNDENRKMTEELTTARRSLLLFQHHDAITGTSKKHVMADYSRQLYEAMNISRDVIELTSEKLLGHPVVLQNFPPSADETIDQRLIEVEQGKEVTVSVYNSLPYALVDVVRLRVSTPHVVVDVVGADGTRKTIQAQIEPSVRFGQVEVFAFILAFPAELGPLGFSQFVIRGDVDPEATVVATVAVLKEQKKEFDDKAWPELFDLSETSEFRLQTQQLSTRHNPTTGLITEIASSTGGAHAVEMDFVEFNDARGGAYLMRLVENSKSIDLDSPRFIVTGPIQQSVHVFHEHIYISMNVKNIQGVLGAQVDISCRVDITKTHNTELMMRIDTSLRNTRSYADSVGMQLLRRDNYPEMSIASNYYPMPSAAVVEDVKHRATIVSDVEHGVRFVKDGVVEIGLDRMLNQDDGKGLGMLEDAIPTDLKPVDINFGLLFEQFDKSSAKKPMHYTAHTPAGHIAVQRILYPPIVFSAKKTGPVQSPPSQSLPSFPCQVQLLTVRKVPRGTLLILFRHSSSCSTTPVSCGIELKPALSAYLTSLGAAKVQKVDLSGVTKIGESANLSDFDFEIKPFDFLSMIIN